MEYYHLNVVLPLSHINDATVHSIRKKLGILAKLRITNVSGLSNSTFFYKNNKVPPFSSE